MKSLMKNLFAVVVLCCLGSMTVNAQDRFDSEVYVSPDDLLLPGYAQKISGTDFTYGTAIPGMNETMIVRATDGNWSMEWQTASVPETVDQEYVSFIWGADIDARNDDIPMELMINDSERISFELTLQKEWTVKNGSSISLSFKESITDPNGDYFGFMNLRMPTNQLQKGKPLTLKVTGGDAGSNGWYMTVKKELRETLEVSSNPALLTLDGKNVQPLAVSLIRFGEPGQLLFELGNEMKHEFEAEFGLNQFVIYHPEVEEETTKSAELDTGLNFLSVDAVIKPVRKWKLHLVQNTHTDIGYTRPQTEIMSDLIRHLDLALDYMDATDHLPDDSKFRWTAENTWAVDQFLQNRPDSQVERLRKRVEEGRLELTGMYLNFDELPDEQVLARSLEPIERIQSKGFDITTAMQNDVNGIGWAFNDTFNSLGVKYLNMGTHGHKALIAFDHPTPFWWESPSGNRMLAFRAEHYHFGNFQFHISRQNFEYFEKKLLEYLNNLGEKGYPYDVMMVQHSGYQTDNSPPSTLPAEMIRKWNEKYEWPKLRFSIARDFFEEVEEKHGDELPVYRAAWPDWWVDGFGSGAREMATTRQAQLDIIAGQGLLGMARMMGHKVENHTKEQIDLTNEALLFYGEHTFGSHASVRDPHGKETLEMRRMKESFAYEALRRSKLVQEDAFGLIQSHVPNLEQTSLLVVNPYPGERSEIVQLFIDHETVPDGSSISLVDTYGNRFPAQKVRTIHGGTYWAFRPENIPSLGYRQYILAENEESAISMSVRLSGNVYENEWYRLEVDPDKGTISSLRDKDLDLELVDEESDWGMGQFIYEELGNRVELDQYYLESYERSALNNVQYLGIDQGPIWDTIRFSGNTKAAIGENGFEFEIRMHHHEKKIELVYLIEKKAVTEPEGIYIAMPFKLSEGKIFHDVPGGMIESGVEQIPGSSNDWNMVQNLVSIENEKTRILVGTHEAPLMQLGGINTGRFESGAKPESTHIYGWPMNNYWVTNFNADQEGGFEWRYSISSGRLDQKANPEVRAFENRLPILARVIPASKSAGNETQPVERSLLSEFPENVLPVVIRPGEKQHSILMHLRETAGKSTSFHPFPGNKSRNLYETDVNGKVLNENAASTIQLQPYEVKFYRVSLQE